MAPVFRIRIANDNRLLRVDAQRLKRSTKQNIIKYKMMMWLQETYLEIAADERRKAADDGQQPDGHCNGQGHASGTTSAP